MAERGRPKAPLTLTDDEVLDAVDESYRMIVAKLPKKDRPA